MKRTPYKAIHLNIDGINHIDAAGQGLYLIIEVRRFVLECMTNYSVIEDAFE